MPNASLLDYRNTNSLWSSVLVETLARRGLQYAVISPGSRSAPLTIAFARHRAIESIPVLDERSAAFFALGLAQRTHRPVVLLCTSGTAGANYFPAIIEAQESGVPLIVITADRPPEMRECRSGQTIDQQKLFGRHVNFHHEFAVPVASVALLRYLRQTVAHAWERATGPAAGPVHLNAPFRDPLPPVEDGTAAGLRGELDESRFFAAVMADRAATLAQVEGPLRLGGRGLIVAGQARPADPVAYAKAVGTVARRLGWPVLADALSPLRNQARFIPGLIPNYGVLARNEKFTARQEPERVLCLGDWPTSKFLRQWLQSLDLEVVMVNTSAQNPDALHARTRWLRCGVEALPAILRPGRRAKGWRAQWVRADARVRGQLARAVRAREEMFEGRVCALLPKLLPKGTPVFVANSMPVRDAESFWPVNDRGHALYFNRGANGIDGTLSTALGLAHGGRPAVLLTGDLALLHDTNGFLQARALRGSLTVVLVNNDGGGIFEHLPVAQFDPPFEKFFATPQGMDFHRLCAAYGVRRTLVRNWAHFARLLARLPARGVRVLEVRTDRKHDAAARQALFARLAHQLPA